MNWCCNGFKPCENYLKVMWVFWVDLDPPMGVSATCGGCRNAPICLRNVQKTLVQGTLIVAEILISPSPCICSTWPGFWVPVLSPLGCQHLPSGLKYSYVSQKLLKKLVHGALIEAEILTLPPQMYLLNLAKVSGYQCSVCRCVNTSQVV